MTHQMTSNDQRQGVLLLSFLFPFRVLSCLSLLFHIIRKQIRQPTLVNRTSLVKFISFCDSPSFPSANSWQHTLFCFWIESRPNNYPIHLPAALRHASYILFAPQSQYFLLRVGVSIK